MAGCLPAAFMEVGSSSITIAVESCMALFHARQPRNTRKSFPLVR